MEPPEIGTVVEETRTFRQRDFDRFAAVSGDDNPIHVDAGYAAATRFGATVAHGMLLFSALCAVLARAFPGARLEEHRLVFPAPTYAEVPMRLRLEVMSSDRRGAVLSTRILDPEGEATCTGEAVLEWGRP